MNPKRWIAPVTAVTTATGLVTAMVIGGAAPSAGAATAAHVSRPAVPEYYMALPGGDNFGNVPGAPTAVVGDTLTGKRLLTVRPSGKDKFVSVSAAADDRTFVLGAAPGLSPPAIPTATDWYLVHFTPGARFRDTVRKLRIPAPPKDGFVGATALSPDGREVALLGETDPFPKPAVEWLRIYSVATGALVHSWSGPLDVDWGGYVTLSWTSGGHQLGIGYTFTVTPAGSKRSWEYVGVRTLDVRNPGHALVADSRLVWSRLTRDTWFTSPTPLSCALDIRVLISADGMVVCAASGLLRTYNPNFNGPACPAVPKWASLGFLAYPTAGSKQVRTTFEYDTNCIPGGDDVLWTNASGDAVIGWYALGEPIPGTTQTTRFGVFGDDGYTPLPTPPTTASVPQTIAW